MGTSPALHTLFFIHQEQRELITWRRKHLRNLKLQAGKACLQFLLTISGSQGDYEGRLDITPSTLAGIYQTRALHIPKERNLIRM